MNIHNSIVFNIEILYLKAMISKNKKVEKNYGDVLIYLKKNRIENTTQVNQIPTGKKTRELIRDVILNGDNKMVSEFVTMMCKMYDRVYSNNKGLLEKSKHLRIRMNVMFMYRMNNIFYYDDMFKNVMYNRVNKVLRDEQVKNRIDNNKIEDWIEDMKEWIDPYFDWDMETEDYYVQFAILKMIRDVVEHDKNHDIFEGWMKVAPMYIVKYHDTQNITYKPTVLDIGAKLMLK